MKPAEQPMRAPPGKDSLGMDWNPPGGVGEGVGVSGVWVGVGLGVGIGGGILTALTPCGGGGVRDVVTRIHHPCGPWRVVGGVLPQCVLLWVPPHTNG